MPLSEDQLKNKYSEETRELERQLNEKDRLLDSYKSEKGKLDVFFRKLTEAVTPVIPLHVTFKKQEKSNADVVPCMQISDVHMGAVQEPEEIEMFNAFNPEICRNRQMAYANRFMNWVEMHRKAYNINECAVIVTGDLISGDIHEELRVTNAFTTPEQIVHSAALLTDQITSLAPNFEKITIHFIVEDNHARLTKKPQAKEAGKNSLNYLVAILAEQYLSRHSNVDFRIYPQFEKVIDVNARKYLITHGHKIVGWMGVPWYSIERRVAKEAMARMSIIMNDINRAKDIGFHKFVFGHWHTPFDAALYMCSGSVSGTDAYDHGQGRFADPSQVSWMVHPKYGEFDRINFNLKFYE